MAEDSLQRGKVARPLEEHRCEPVPQVVAPVGHARLPRDGDEPIGELGVTLAVIVPEDEV
jgi:hypothetical protein